jgi:hypothetical protein
MTSERKRLENEASTSDEAVDALITGLKEAGYTFNYDKPSIKYHIDVGLLVMFKSQGRPNFPLDTAWLIETTGFDWLLQSMDEVAVDVFDVVFRLEVEI